MVISALADRFGSREFPLSRVRYTKLAYLLHRHVEKKPEGYLKKAAGPYNPRTRYGGPERIAQDKGYVVVAEAESGIYKGFVPGPNIGETRAYFEKWYGERALQWLERFRFKKTEHLGLLATVDHLMRSQSANHRAITTNEVRSMLRDDPDWKHKLDQEEFSEANITKAIAECHVLFQSE